MMELNWKCLVWFGYSRLIRLWMEKFSNYSQWWNVLVVSNGKRNDINRKGFVTSLWRDGRYASMRNHRNNRHGQNHVKDFVGSNHRYISHPEKPYILRHTLLNHFFYKITVLLRIRINHPNSPIHKLLVLARILPVPLTIPLCK